MWFNAQSIVPTSTSPYGVALAVHAGKLHMVYADNSHAMHHGVYTMTDTGGSWNITTILGQTTQSTPALIDYHGVLTCVYKGNASTANLFITTLNDANNAWTPTNTQISSATAPSVALHDGLLFVVFGAPTSFAVNYATWNGLAWSAAAPINTITNPTSRFPAIASYHGQLHLLTMATASPYSFQHYIYAGSLVPNQAFIPLAAPGFNGSQGAALVDWNGLLTALYTAAGSEQVMLASFDGGSWTAPASTISTNTIATPAAAVLGGSLQLVYPSTNNIVQSVGFADGTAPLSRIPLAGLGNNATVVTGVPYTIFGGLRPYTIEAWVNVTSTSGTQYIASAYNASANDGMVALAIHNGRLAVWRKGYWLQSQTVPAANTWYHVAATYDGSAYTCLYVNGNLESTEINNQPVIPNSTGPVMIGAASAGTSGSPTGKLQGMVRWVAFFTVARSAEEVSNDLYARPDPQPGLFALYDFAGSTPTDVSGHAQSATVQGTLQPRALTQCLQLSGANGVNCGAGTTLSFAGNQAMSADAWVYPTSNSTTSAYVLQRSGAYSLGLSTSGWFGSVAGQAVLSSGHAPTLDQWTHLAITWVPSGTSGTATLYVNGVAVKTQSQSSTAAASNNPTSIGCTSSGGSGFHGDIACVRVWSKTLSLNDVKAAMTQSPVGMDDLAANYDFSTTPIVDATNNNTVFSITDPTNPYYPGNLVYPAPIGAPGQGYLTETITSQVAAQLVGVDTSVSVPYFPGQPGEVLAFQTPPITPSRPSAAAGVARVRTVDEVLSPEFLQQLLGTFERALPPGLSDTIREHLKAEHGAELRRLFLLAQTDPLHGLGGHRFTWRRHAEHTVLVHHRPDGTSVDAVVLATAAFTEQQLWWIQFIMTLVFGFASILGISTPGSLAGKLTKYITKNPVILTVVETVVEIGVAITPEVIYNTLNKLWKSNFLMGMLKLIAVELGWWALAQLAIRLLGLFIPGVQEMIVATMLVNFTIMAIQLSLLATTYPAG